MITITRDAWKKFAPKCPPNYTAALFDNMALLQEAGLLENERRWCHFAGVIYEETGGFSEIRENMRYTTTKALRSSWPSRFGHKSDAELAHLLKNPEGLAEVVYGIHSGRKPEDLGNKLPGDGYAFRGGGWFNTTGRGCVEGYCAKLGLPVPASPTVLDDPVATLKFAVLEWHETGCNALADENDLRKIAKAINTGSANSGIEPVGMDGRKAAFARAWGLWGETGQADAPAAIDDVKAAVRGALVKYAVPAGAAGTGGVHLASTSGTAPAPKVDVSKALAKGAEVRQTVEQAKDLGSWAKGFGGWAMTGEGAGVLMVMAIGTAALLMWARRSEG